MDILLIIYLIGVAVVFVARYALSNIYNEDEPYERVMFLSVFWPLVIVTWVVLFIVFSIGIIIIGIQDYIDKKKENKENGN